MNKEKWIDGYVDSITLRLDMIDKKFRDLVYSKLIHFIKETKLVGLYYDEEKSSSYYQSTKLISSNTTIGEIGKGGCPTPYSNITNYYINISFHGLKSHNKKVEDKSELVLKNIVAFINSNEMPEASISQFDICTDVYNDIEHLVVVCVNRKSRKQYYPLGKNKEDGTLIQLYEGTYEVEKFVRDDDKKKFITKEELQEAIAKRRSNVQKRAVLYDKRLKILDKTDFDIGYDLTRFEMKLQARHFSSNKEVSANAFLQELKDYKLLYFDDLKQKESFINQYNKANSNKHRDALISEVSKTATTIKTNMKYIGEFIRMIDTIKFDGKGGFIIPKKENYLYGTSKFNRFQRI